MLRTGAENQMTVRLIQNVDRMAGIMEISLDSPAFRLCTRLAPWRSTCPASSGASDGTDDRGAGKGAERRA